MIDKLDIALILADRLYLSGPSPSLELLINKLLLELEEDIFNNLIQNKELV